MNELQTHPSQITPAGRSALHFTARSGGGWLCLPPGDSR